MLLAIEEQVFAMLADALLKQTNNKKKSKRGKESKTKLNTSSVSVFMKEERRIVLTSMVKMMVCWRGNILGKS